MALTGVLACTGCTVVGTALSPVTGPVDAVWLAIEADAGADAIWQIPLMIMCSPMVAMMTGMGADYRYLDTGDLRVDEILRPLKHMTGH